MLTSLAENLAIVYVSNNESIIFHKMSPHVYLSAKSCPFLGYPYQILKFMTDFLSPIYQCLILCSSTNKHCLIIVNDSRNLGTRNPCIIFDGKKCLFAPFTV